MVETIATVSRACAPEYEISSAVQTWYYPVVPTPEMYAIVFEMIYGKGLDYAESVGALMKEIES